MCNVFFSIWFQRENVRFDLYYTPEFIQNAIYLFLLRYLALWNIKQRTSPGLSFALSSRLLHFLLEQSMERKRKEDVSVKGLSMCSSRTLAKEVWRGQRISRREVNNYLDSNNNFYLEIRMDYILIFIIGLLFGSFGSVMLHRLGDDITWKKIQTVLRGRSHCPHCKHTLARYDLFPLFSWLSTRGTCRYCGAPVSKLYPLLEIGAWLVFLGIFYRWQLYWGGDMWLLGILLFINRCFYLLMVHDIQTMYLHPVVWRLALAGWAALLVYRNPLSWIIEAGQRIMIFSIGFLLFYRWAKLYVRLRRKEHGEWIGQWDVMIAPIVGVVIWKIVSLIIWNEAVSSFFAQVQYFWYYVIASCIAALLLLIITPITREGEKRMIPFFPGMMCGVWIMMIISEIISVLM